MCIFRWELEQTRLYFDLELERHKLFSNEIRSNMRILNCIGTDLDAFWLELEQTWLYFDFELERNRSFSN